MATGICASDLKYLRWGSTQIAGHEFAGVLVDGTAVAVEGFFGCEKCEQCEQGTYNMCAKPPSCARHPLAGTTRPARSHAPESGLP